MKVLKALKDLGPRVWVEKIQQVAKRGTPDLLICANGHFVAWELKVGTNKTTELQQFTLEKILISGGVGRVVTPENLKENMEELCGLLKSSKQ